jgi:hypothetical protein
MKPKSRVWVFIGLLVLILYLTACASSPPTSTITPLLTTPPPKASQTPTQEITTPTFTPTSCTGWSCTIEGVVYAGEAASGKELGGAVVTLSQFSYCSPTHGEQEVVTGEDGTFAFEVYLHDTDSFHFKVELDGYLPGEYSFGGFDCLYCSCSSLEIILQPE